MTGVAAAAVSVGADPDRDDRTLAAVLLVLMHAITRQPVADLDVGPVAAKLVRLRLATAYASSGASVATIVTAVPYAATSVMMSPIALQSKRMAIMALAPRFRASCLRRALASFRLSASSFVYPATLPPDSVRREAPALERAFLALTINPNTSP